MNVLMHVGDLLRKLKLGLINNMATRTFVSMNDEFDQLQEEILWPTLPEDC